MDFRLKINVKIRKGKQIGQSLKDTFLSGIFFFLALNEHSCANES